jgi:HEPN domain-containing protein
MQPETDRWWRQAQADLATAKVNLATDRFYAVSWFVQQAVEKGLKAVYIEQRQVIPPRTHNLSFLGTEVGIPKTTMVDLNTLNPTFDMSRYPDPATGQIPEELITRPLAEAHLAAGERAFTWIIARLQI